jgi:CRISPR system Cascade subunit CasB
MTETKGIPEQQFIERVEQLDSGKLAMLRRGCGERDPVEGRCPWLLGLIHGAASEAAAFLVASLLAQYSTSAVRAGHHRAQGDFGRTWRLAVAKSDSESIKRRFLILLDADFDPRTGEGDLPHRLCQMVRYAVSKGVGVEWPSLLRDLKYWNGAGKPVQKRWARSFFAPEDPGDRDKKE